MKRLRLLGALLIAGGLCAAAAPAVTHASSSVVYHVTFKKGTLKGWTITKHGWKISHGLLVTNGHNSYDAQAPFHTKGLTSYAVEVVMKVGPIPDVLKLRDLGMMVNYGHSNSSPGVYAGIATTGSSERPVAGVIQTVEGQIPVNYDGTKWTPDSSFHTFRLEVQGNAYRELIDGIEVVGWSQLPAQQADGIGVSTYDQPAAVKSIRVIKLQPTNQSAEDPSSLISRALTPDDTQLPIWSADYRDNVVFSLDNGMTLTDVDNAHQVGNLTEYFLLNNYASVIAGFTQFSDAASAQADYATELANGQSTMQKLNGQEVSISGLGANSYAYTDTTKDSSGTWYEEVILIAAGDYVGGVDFSSQKQTDLSQAPVLAQKLYAKLSS